MEVTISVFSKETCNQKTPGEGGEAAHNTWGSGPSPPTSRVPPGGVWAAGEGKHGRQWLRLEVPPPHPGGVCQGSLASLQRPSQKPPTALRGQTSGPLRILHSTQRAGLTLIPEDFGDQIDCPALPLNHNGPIIPPPSPDPISKPQ